MDKFTFDDIIFNVGVRVDRFDANQSVLKDPYVIGNSYNVGDVTNNSNGASLIEQQIDGEVVIPDNIEDDYVVYVDALENPNAIVGFRDGDTWYNAVGAEINDPDILADGINVNPEDFMKPIGKKLPILTLQSPNLSLTSRNEEGT